MSVETTYRGHEIKRTKDLSGKYFTVIGGITHARATIDQLCRHIDKVLAPVKDPADRIEAALGAMFAQSDDIAPPKHVPIIDGAFVENKDVRHRTVTVDFRINGVADLSSFAVYIDGRYHHQISTEGFKDGANRIQFNVPYTPRFIVQLAARIGQEEPKMSEAYYVLPKGERITDSVSRAEPEEEHSVEWLRLFAMRDAAAAWNTKARDAHAAAVKLHRYDNARDHLNHVAMSDLVMTMLSAALKVGD